MKVLIAIPARYASKRFPGKPLALILGKSMLQRVYDIATKAINIINEKEAKIEISCIVATDDQKIMDFCEQNNIPVALTSESCKTGTDRICDLIDKIPTTPDFIINLQGDNPLCPPWFLSTMIKIYQQEPEIDVITPGVALSWDELDALRISKTKQPFSGTTVITNKDLYAIWFSKNIIPAIRNEQQWRDKMPDISPVVQHIGLYGYSLHALQKINKLKESFYEKYEELEQLRFLENGLKIRVAMVDYAGRVKGLGGIDSPDDIPRAEEVLQKYGEF